MDGIKDNQKRLSAEHLRGMFRSTRNLIANHFEIGVVSACIRKTREAPILAPTMTRQELSTVDTP